MVARSPAREYSPNELGTVDYDCGQILKLSYKRSASSGESLKSSFLTFGQLLILGQDGKELEDPSALMSLKLSSS